MILNAVTQYAPAIIAIVIVSFVSNGLTKLISKKSMKLTFVIPAIFALLVVLFAYLAFSSTDWGRLGYFLYASFSAIGFIGSLISSLVLWKRNQK